MLGWIIALVVIVALVGGLKLLLTDGRRPRGSGLRIGRRARGVDNESTRASDEARLTLHTHGAPPIHDQSFDKPR
jgi:hypothetical protein